MSSEFNDYFKKEIYKETLKYYKQWKDSRDKSNLFLKVFLGIVIVTVILCLIYKPHWIEITMAAFLVSGLAFFLLYKDWFKYEKTIKKEILPLVLKYKNLQIADEAQRQALKRLVKTLKIFPSYDSYSCDDFVIGEYKGLRILIAELDLERETRNSKGERSKVPVFNGIFVSFTNPNPQKAVLVLRPDKARHFSLNSALKQVHLEDPEFEKYYDIYSNDQIESRNILTPAFMNRVVEVNKKLSFKSKILTIANNFYLSYEYENINITFANFCKNLFEFRLDQSPCDVNTYKEMIDDIEQIYEVIDMLNLAEEK